MTLATSSVLGFALLRCLAALRRWRPLSLRFAEEQAAIGAWLAALAHSLPLHAGHAAALAELPRLRKGYSDTFERGRQNYERIFALLVAPCSAPDDASALALRQAIAAALADPEQKALARNLGQPLARPVVWAQRESSGSRPATNRP